MTYSHIRIFMLGEEVGGAWSGGRRVLFPFDQIFQILYMFKIFCIVALGSYVTFSPNQNFPGEEGVTFLTNLSEISSPFYEGSFKISQLRMMKTDKSELI